MSDVLSGTGVPTNDPKNIHDMTAFIQQSLTDMQGKFTNMSDQVNSADVYGFSNYVSR